MADGDLPRGATAAAGGRSPPHAVVVGAGPAGVLSAMLLANQGLQVDVYERMEPQAAVSGHDSVQATIGPRSFNLLLAERATVALEKAGISLAGIDIPRCETAYRHRLRGAPGAAMRMPTRGRIHVSNRGVLAGELFRQCRARHSERVRFHFGQELVGLDTRSSTAAFAPARRDAGEQVGEGSPAAAAGESPLPAAGGSVRYDLLVGADGAGSRVRQALARADDGLEVRQTQDVMEYKAMGLGPAAPLLPTGVSPAGTFHTWSDSKLQATLIASSTSDGQLRGVLVLPEGVHATLGTAAAYQRFLADTFPSLPADVVARAAAGLVDAPVSNGGLLTRCSKLSSGNVALVGDAAHSVYPALGQGANAALEGAAALATALAACGGARCDAAGLAAAAADYSERWLPQAHAVVELTEHAFGGNMRAFAPSLKLAQLICQMLLHKALPFLVPPPAFLQLNSTTTPYAEILTRSLHELSVFKACLASLGAALVAATAWALRPCLT